MAQSVHGSYFEGCGLLCGGYIENYYGPIEVRRSLGKGRGLFLTKDVKEGDPLIVEVPFITSKKLDDKDGVMFPTLDVTNRKAFGPSNESMIAAILNKVRDNKADCARLSLLYDGIETNEVIPDMDLFRVDDHRSVNLLAKPLNITQIRGILSLNCFGEGCKSTTLYIVSSFMNHSSCPNTYNMNFDQTESKTRTVLAARDLKAGVEITTTYGAIRDNNHWGIKPDEL
jgi:hypothetical protein